MVYLYVQITFQICLHRPEGAGSNQTRLSLGMFTVYPAFGSIPAGNLQTVTVDSIAEIQGQSEEVHIC